MDDVIVIGGGPAGLSAALLLGRARRSVLVLDAGSPRNRFAAQVHGLLGNEGTEPAVLLERGRAEVEGYGVRIERSSVTRVDQLEDRVRVTTSGGESLSARAVVVASGMSDRLADVPGLRERWGSTVLHCPYCHGWEVRGRRLGVLVPSPERLPFVELVRQWSDDVVAFVADAGPLDASTERRLRARGVRVVTSPVIGIVGDAPAIEYVELADGGTVALDALFAGGPAEPHDGFLTHLGLTREETPFGSFLAVDGMGRTSAERIWAAGNIVNPGATVPVSIAAGAMVGGAVNMALVTEDFGRALSTESAA